MIHILMNKGSRARLSVDLKNEGHWVAQSDGKGLKRVGLLREEEEKFSSSINVLYVPYTEFLCLILCLMSRG